VIAYHRVRRGSTRWFRHVVLPSLGFVVIAYVLSGLSASAIELGITWLAAGAVYYLLLRFVLHRSTGLSLDAPTE